MIKKITVFILIIIISFFFCKDDTDAMKDFYILNSPTATKEQIKEWSINVNASDLYQSWIDIGYDIAIEYGVDPTVLFAQTAIETGYGRFGGTIDETYYNTAGIKNYQGGDNKDPNAHMRFKSWKIGFTAQAQHLSLYAGNYITDKDKVVDPRHFKGLKGTAKTVNSLSSKWASSSSYGNLVNNLCEDICDTKVDDKKSSNNSSTKKILTNEKDNTSITDKIKNTVNKNLDSKNYAMNDLKNRISNRRKGVNKNYILKILNK